MTDWRTALGERPRQAAQVDRPHRVPLITTIQNRDETFDKDSRLVNAFAEFISQEKDYWVEKRPGLLAQSSFSGTGLGLYNWRGDVYCVFGSTFYKNGVSMGTVDSTSSYVFEEMLGTGWLVLGNGVKAYYTDGTTLEELASFGPVRAGLFLIDSFYEILDPGNTDFTALGAADNNPGTLFQATGIGDPLTTGTAVVRAASIAYGVMYQIHTLADTDFTTFGASSNTVGVVFTSIRNGMAGLDGEGTVLMPNFPASFVKGWAYLDGTLYVMDENAQIWGTSTLSYGGVGGFDDPRLWDPLNMIVARIEPDPGVTILKHHTYVIALKQWTSEAFYDAASPTGSPLRPVSGAHSTFGCATADSLQEIDGSLVWLSRNKMASLQVVRMDDLRIQVISTPPIERLLKGSDTTQVLSWSLKHGGHRFYGITLKSNNITLVYDLDQLLWYQWTDTDGNYWPIAARSFDSNHNHLMQHDSNGKLYYVGGAYEYPNDDGELISVDIYTPNFDGGIGRRKQLHVMQFNTDQGDGSKLQIRFSEDDYQTWTNFREVSLSNKRPILTNCGTFYRRAWHFRHRANTPLRLKSIDMQLDIGTL
jgi:hypothetical protein